MAQPPPGLPSRPRALPIMKPSSVAALRAVAEALLPPCDERAAAAGAAGEPAAAALWAHTGGGDEVVYKVRMSKWLLWSVQCSACCR